MKVLVVGAGKSPNVGDQLIEKVLGWTLQNKLDIDTVSYFDLEQGKYNIDYKQPEVDVDEIKENVEQQKKYYLRPKHNFPMEELKYARRKNIICMLQTYNFL